MRVEVDREGEEVVFTFTTQEDDKKRPSDRYELGKKVVRVGIDSATSKEIHPDLIALSVILMCHPFVGSELHFPLGVSKRFKDTMSKVVSRYNFISPDNEAIEPRGAKENYFPGLAYSGGVDSTAALSVMPRKTVPIFMNRPLNGKTLYNPEAALTSCKLLKELGFDAKIVDCDVEYMRNPVGFPTDLSHSIPAILLADYLMLDSISFGTVMESAFGIGHEKFRDYGSGSHWRFYGSIFKAAGIPIGMPVSGVSEVGTSIIAGLSPLGWLSQSCIRGTWNNPCENCWKCCRKGLLNEALGMDEIGRSGISRLFTSNEVQKKVSCLPISHENVIEYAIQKLGDMGGDTFSLIRDRIDRGTNLEFLERWYSPSIDYVPEKYRREIKERILSYLRPMGKKQEVFVEKWDMSDFLEEESTKKKSDSIRRHFEGQ